MSKEDLMIRDKGKWHKETGKWYDDLWIMKMLKQEKLKALPRKRPDA